MNNHNNSTVQYFEHLQLESRSNSPFSCNAIIYVKKMRYVIWQSTKILID